MKTFLNVLYRRILYKIPLKFLLVLLAILAVFVASVKADSFDGAISLWANPLLGGETVTFGSTLGDFTCISTSSSSCNNFTITLGNSTNTGNPYNRLLCVFNTLDHYTVVVNNNTNNSCSFYFIRGFKSDFEDNICTTMSSLECQTEYNLIPISSVDQNYCTTNNLCPTCQVCPAGSGSISTLYINDILHVGSPFIYMNIPEEIGRDYAYTQGGTNMFIDVEGYNVDYEAVQDIIDQQNYKPTQEDFQNIIALLGPYGEIIIFFVFLFIVWAWIKKPFKSKL